MDGTNDTCFVWSWKIFCEAVRGYEPAIRGGIYAFELFKVEVHQTVETWYRHNDALYNVIATQEFGKHYNLQLKRQRMERCRGM